MDGSMRSGYKSLVFPSVFALATGITIESGCEATRFTTASFILHRRIGHVGTLWAAKSNIPVSVPFGCLGRFPSRRATASPYNHLTSVSDRTVSRSRPLELNLDSNASSVAKRPDPVRIAIVGGGIAGITAASAIASRLNDHEITVFEADSNCNYPYQTQQPLWTAATARNANCIVPGVAMHVMAERSTLLSILRDTVWEWSILKYESLSRSMIRTLAPDSFLPKLNIDNFEVVPPYFSVHMLRCMGHHATWEERWTFLTFLRHFLATSVLTGEKEAEDRGRYVFQLAKANREALAKDFESVRDNDLDTGTQLGIGNGFISLHRSKEAASHAMEEAKQFGVRAEMLPWDKAVALEPHIQNLPFGPLFAVHRPDDMTANCMRYVQSLKQKCRTRQRVKFLEDQKGVVSNLECLQDVHRKTAGSSPRFRITTADGLTYETDYVVLAAGVNTPLLARKVGAGHCCPTYPLRGYSLTLHTDEKAAGFETKKRTDHEVPSNLLNRPLSVDSMYCSSVGPGMARLAGYGELVGYRECAKDVPSVGPDVLARYGRTIFPEAVDCTPDAAVQCFRPMSPDDIPIVGKVTCVPGLFLHHGHGTMGWTLTSATADCVAQAICDEVEGRSGQKSFELPDKTHILRSVLSPDRFA